MPKINFKLLCTSLVVLVLSACSTAPVKEPVQPTEETKERLTAQAFIDDSMELENAQQKNQLFIQGITELYQKNLIHESSQLLELIDLQSLPDNISDRQKLILTKLYFQSGLYQRSTFVLGMVNPNNLSSQLTQMHKLYLGLNYFVTGQKDDAYIILMQVQPFEGMLDAELLQLYEARANLLLKVGNYLESARERIALHNMLKSEDAMVHNQRLIWEALSQLKPKTLKLLQFDPPPNELTGWLRLAEISLKHQEQPILLLKSLKLWLSEFPNHPARLGLPEPLERAQAADNPMPKHVALLLPQEGPWAKPARFIQDGFLSANYDLPQDKQVKVSVVNTHNIDIYRAYEKAVLSGAQLIAGPLKKESIGQLIENRCLSLPLLALNYIPTKDALRSNEIYQFSLAPEHELDTIIKFVERKEMKNAAIFIPDSDYGERIKSHFESKWLEDENRKIVSTVKYKRDSVLANEIKTMLNIDQSEKRHKDLQGLLGMKLDFKPRRRQDIDFILLGSPASISRQVNPLIDFYYANDIPIFGLSNNYDGKKGRRVNRDLNGMVFSDIPWLVKRSDSQDMLFKRVNKLWPQISASQARLFSFGYDAYQIMPSLGIFSAFPQYNMSALSGNLSMNPDKQIERELDIAVYKKGKAQYLEQKF